jgi:hypothetical protein
LRCKNTEIVKNEEIKPDFILGASSQLNRLQIVIVDSAFPGFCKRRQGRNAKSESGKSAAQWRTICLEVACVRDSAQFLGAH